MVTFGRFKKHCQLHPEWGAEALKFAAANAKAADRLKGEPGRSKTHCMRGHSLADAYVCQHKQGPNAGYILRHCRQCTALRGREGFKIKSYVALAVTEKLKQHLPIRSFTTGGSPGYLVKHSTFNRYRRENLEFDELVKYSVSNRPIRRVLPTGSVPPGTYKYDWHPGDEAAIRALVPRWTQGREDIVNDIFVALLDGRLDRTQVVDYVKRFLAADDRMFPAKYAKFGDAKLVSLDARLFDDGTATLGDTVSRGLWD
jgi:hypothetical protein